MHFEISALRDAAQAREMVVTAQHRTAGEVRMTGRPIKFPGSAQPPVGSARPPGSAGAPPALG